MHCQCIANAQTVHANGGEPLATPFSGENGDFLIAIVAFFGSPNPQHPTPDTKNIN